MNDKLSVMSINSDEMCIGAEPTIFEIFCLHCLLNSMEESQLIMQAGAVQDGDPVGK